jgi:hypothetical protein
MLRLKIRIRTSININADLFIMGVAVGLPAKNKGLGD